MKKALTSTTSIIFLITLLFTVPHEALAEKQSEESAKLARPRVIETIDPAEREINRCSLLLSTFLSREGPILAPYARTFAEEAYKNNLDCTLVAAIAGHESVFGQHIAVPHNGWGWCGGWKCSFESWEQGIRHVSQTLNKLYCQKWKACNDPYAIGRYYAEDPNWPHRVSSIMRKMKKFPINTTSNLALTI